MEKVSGIIAQAREGAARLEREPGGDPLPPSIEVRCGAAETAAIIQLLDTFEEARDVIEAWDGITQDRHQRARQKYASLLSDLFQRHPEQVLAGLQSPHAHTRTWIALAIAQAPAGRAIPVIKQAMACEQSEQGRKALLNALRACMGHE